MTFIFYEFLNITFQFFGAAAATIFRMAVWRNSKFGRLLWVSLWWIVIAEGKRGFEGQFLGGLSENIFGGGILVSILFGEWLVGEWLDEW